MISPRYVGGWGDKVCPPQSKIHNLTLAQVSCIKEMSGFGRYAMLLLLLIAEDVYGRQQGKVLPNNQYCDPLNGVCRKGDWVARAIADCEHNGANERYTCQAVGDNRGSWIVDVAEGGTCQPKRTDKSFICGATGTNTRCVCSDNKILPNECRASIGPMKTLDQHFQDHALVTTLVVSLGIITGLAATTATIHLQAAIHSRLAHHVMELRGKVVALYLTVVLVEGTLEEGESSPTSIARVVISSENAAISAPD